MRNLALAVLAGLGIWAAFAVQSFLAGHAREIAERDAKIHRLEGDLATLRQENAQLRTALRFLKVDHRLTRIEVLSQEPAGGDPQRVETTLRWQEIGREGQPLGPVGVRPLPYSPEGADPQPPASLWERFWDLANDP